MIPILYSAETTSFGGNHGLGLLSDAISCTVTETINEEFELTLEYPIGGIHFDMLEDRAIIYAKPSPNREPQAFRIYKYTKTLGQAMEFYARHISYDAVATLILPFELENASAVDTVSSINSMVIGNKISPRGTAPILTNPFTLKTDFPSRPVGEGRFDFKNDGIKSLRQLLGTGENTLLGVYGGQLEYDNYDIWLRTKRGRDKGYSYRYGINLTDLTEEQDVSGLYTHVMGYWVNKNDPSDVIYADGDEMYSLGDFDYVKVYPLDVTSSIRLDESQERPDISDITYAVGEHATAGEFEDISKPEMNITIKQNSMFRINGTEEEPLEIGDIVRVYYPKLNINFTEQVVSTDYNVLTNLYNSVEIGEVKKTISRTIAHQSQEIQNVQSDVYENSGGSGGGYGGYAVFG